MSRPELSAADFRMLEAFIDAKIAQAVNTNASGKARAVDRMAVDKARHKLVDAWVTQPQDRHQLGYP